LRPGEVLALEGAGGRVELIEDRGGGHWTVRLPDGGAEAAMREGAVPLPPYILRARKDLGMPTRMPELDQERYQTVYAERPGAVAAPTAGLHFTPELLDELSAAGVEVHMLTLMVGPGTFRPVRAERAEDHDLEAERFRLPAETARAVARALEDGRRIIATGTTTCRVLEYVARRGEWDEQEGWTDLYIYPPFAFRVVDALITNFHLPRSTLLMLVSAFAGRESVLAAYEEAVRERYRFYSYGDAMLIV
ncbi:MAG: S-adenosylmethionine:tRNA ribosyltransferase-isomerase, partial [Desulfuromonadaceae bacterium]